MKKLSTVMAGCALVMSLAGSAYAQTGVRFNLSLGNAPPPPVVVVQHAPRTMWLPDSRVAVVVDRDFDTDMFQSGAFWYTYNDGWWYRSRSWRGPFIAIDYRDVPRGVQMVPARHWRHYPRGMAHGYYRDRGRPSYVDYNRRDWRDNRYDNRYDNRDYDRNGWWRDRWGRIRDRDGRWRDANGYWHVDDGRR